MRESECNHLVQQIIFGVVVPRIGAHDSMLSAMRDTRFFSSRDKTPSVLELDT
jgi:hypothetical protein